MEMTKKICQCQGDCDGKCFANEFSETPDRLRDLIKSQVRLIYHLKRIDSSEDLIALKKENEELRAKLSDSNIELFIDKAIIDTLREENQRLTKELRDEARCPRFDDCDFR
jgi:hypothetical protein